MKIKGIVIAFIAFVAIVFSTNAANVIEVTSFKLMPNVQYADFNLLDTKVERDFTSKQPGFIHRESAMTEKGEYVVIVFWESSMAAKASMKKFMNDASVKEYASMIDGATMNMAQYDSKNKFNAEESGFVEVMSFNLKEDVKGSKFGKTNKKVEKDFTSNQNGFLQRIIGESDDRTQIVLVWWDTKANSDAALPLFMKAPIAETFMSMMDQKSIKMGRYISIDAMKELPEQLSNKDKAVALLNSFNTGDQSVIAYINAEKYTQHNLSVADGLEGFGEVMKYAPPEGFSANVVRAFQDGDYVFTHSEYDFFGDKIGVDIFRFEEGLIVEHWDNLIDVQEPNPSNHTQIDGSLELADIDKTEANKTVVREFIEKVLLNHEMDKLTNYINASNYTQHNPAVGDGLEGFGQAMKYFQEQGLVMEYTKLHMVLGEGNFVLAVSEGKFGKGEHTAYYDLFRLEEGKIVEHWDVIATIPSKEEWKNTNGKF